MQSRHRFVVPFFLLSAVIACNGGPIVVREAADCTGSDAPNSASVVLHQGDTVREGKTLKTGAGGRIQLDYGSGLVRVGSKSLLRVQNNGQVELHDGAFLFQNVSGKQVLIVSTASREVRISGDTGFVRVERGRDENDTTVAIGALSGLVQVQNGTRSYKLAPADLVVVSAAGAVGRQQFDLHKQMSSSRLLSEFKSRLPQLGNISGAERQFAALQRRGFVRPADFASTSTRAGTTAGSLVGEIRQRPMVNPSGGTVASLGSPLQGVTIIAREGVFLGTSDSASGEFLFRIPGNQEPKPQPPHPPDHPPHQRPPGGGH